MDKKNIVLVSLISLLFLIGLASASYIRDINNSDLSNLSVTIGPNSSQVDFYLGNTSGYDWDIVNIPFRCFSNGTLVVSDFSSSGVPSFLTSMLSSSSSQFCSTLSSSLGEDSGNITFRVSDLLSSVQSINTNFQNGDNTPTINSVSLNGNTPIYMSFSEPSNLLSGLAPGAVLPIIKPVKINLTIVSSLKISTNLDGLLAVSLNKTASEINGSFLTGLIEKYASQSPYQVQMIGDATFVKNGDNYVVTYNKGFGSDPEEYIPIANEIIAQSSQMFNVADLISKYVLPTAQSYSELNNYTDLLENNLGWFNYSYNASADLLNVKFQSGTHTYPIPLNLRDSSGDIADKTIYLTLENVPETFKPVLFEENSSEGQWVSNVTGIPYGENLTLVVFDKLNLTSNQSSKISSALKVFKIMNFTLSGSETDGYITFKVNSSEVSNASRVSLYVWEDSASNWTKLSTTLLSNAGGVALYKAYTSHFSTFMVAENTSVNSSPTPTPSPSPSSSERSSGSYYYNNNPIVVGEPNNNNVPTQPSEPTNNNPATNLNGNGITGGVIGALGPAGIATIAGLLVIGLGTVIFFVAKRKISSKKK